MASLKKISVHAKSENSSKIIVEARSFKLIIDEPKISGGTNTGANPLEYMLAALSGCLNVVGHLIAKEMGFTLRGLEIDLEAEIDLAKLRGKPTQGRTGCTAIRVTIKADADADDVILAKWLKTVESRCPVSDNLSNSTPLIIELG